MANATLLSGTAMLVLRFARRLWVRVSLMALLALMAAVGTTLLEGFIPQGLRTRMPAEAIMPVLTILASGMLAVSTFSLNVMVTAYHAAASQATPRAHRILLADTTTQTVLATFIGAFVYALSAIILIQAGFGAQDSSVMYMAVTVAVVVLVILAMLRWIDHLSDLGSMDATLRKAEAEARNSLKQTRTAPAQGATPLTAETVIPTDASPIPAPQSGYLQLIDAARIDKVLNDAGARVYLHVSPGQFVLKGHAMGYACGLDDNGIDAVQAALTLGQYRTFEQDAAYGLLVLSEIASRALSPGINDPGTAIDVIARQERLIWEWACTPPTQDASRYERVFAPALEPETLIANAFASTARDGADKIEVVCRLLHALRSLATSGDRRLAAAARDVANRTRDHAQAALTLEADRERMHQAYSAEGVFIPSP